MPHDAGDKRIVNSTTPRCHKYYRRNDAFVLAWEGVRRRRNSMIMLINTRSINSEIGLACNNNRFFFSSCFVPFWPHEYLNRWITTACLVHLLGIVIIIITPETVRLFTNKTTNGHKVIIRQPGIKSSFAPQPLVNIYPPTAHRLIFCKFSIRPKFSHHSHLSEAGNGNIFTA